jgi:hypothetical protein
MSRMTQQKGSRQTAATTGLYHRGDDGSGIWRWTADEAYILWFRRFDRPADNRLWTEWMEIFYRISSLTVFDANSVTRYTMLAIVRVCSMNCHSTYFKAAAKPVLASRHWDCMTFPTSSIIPQPSPWSESTWPAAFSDLLWNKPRIPRIVINLKLAACSR